MYQMFTCSSIVHEHKTFLMLLLEYLLSVCINVLVTSFI